MLATNTLVEFLEKIARSGVNLTTWEENFTEAMMSKVEMYGDKVVFSEKQAEQIERVYAERCP